MPQVEVLGFKVGFNSKKFTMKKNYMTIAIFCIQSLQVAPKI
jgi:hypothetical protein